MESSTPLHMQEINISGCAAITFCSSGTKLEIWLFPFISGDGTGSVPMLMTNVPLSAGHQILRIWICSHLAAIPFLSTGLLPIGVNIFF